MTHGTGIDQYIRTGASCTLLWGRSMQTISSTPSITRRGVSHSFDTTGMDRIDLHDSNPSTRVLVPTPTTVSESDTAALGAPSGARKGGRASGFARKKAGAGLESIFFKIAPDRLHSPRLVANQIRRLCRHDETTFLNVTWYLQSIICQIPTKRL